MSMKNFQLPRQRLQFSKDLKIFYQRLISFILGYFYVILFSKVILSSSFIDLILSPTMYPHRCIFLGMTCGILTVFSLQPHCHLVRSNLEDHILKCLFMMLQETQSLINLSMHHFYLLWSNFSMFVKHKYGILSE